MISEYPVNDNLSMLREQKEDTFVELSECWDNFLSLARGRKSVVVSSRVVPFKVREVKLVSLETWLSLGGPGRWEGPMVRWVRLG